VNRPCRRASRAGTPLPSIAVVAVWLLMPAAADAAGEEHPGLAIFREHCQDCHGEGGGGSDTKPEPLVGDRSLSQLAGYIEQAMPEGSPEAVTGEAARQVADYIHGAFYSALARDRNRPAREQLSRLTVRQHRESLADLVGSFGGHPPGIDPARGLRGEYFSDRNFDRKRLIFERTDRRVDFDFGIEGPDPEQFRPNRFAIRWLGSIVPLETGEYEFIVRSPQSVKLAVNTAWNEPPLIDATVSSGDSHEHRGRLFLLGGRAYPIRLEFSKANQGVDNKDHEPSRPAFVKLVWKPPHGVEEVIPPHCLIPRDAPPSFVAATPFPPDDRSIGYERGTSVSQAWLEAASAAAIETADYVVDHADRLAGVSRDAGDRREKLEAFAGRFAERAFRRPLSKILRGLIVERPFAEAPDLDSAVKRSVFLATTSPRFLYRGLASAAAQAGEPKADSYDVAERLSFGLWDSLPDRQLLEAAAKGQLSTPQQVAAQVRRMLSDRRSRAKLRDFLMHWLRVDDSPQLVKDSSRFSAFSPAVAAGLRTSLQLWLDEVLCGEHPDFRRLFTDKQVYLDGRLAALYGAPLHADAEFRPLCIDDGRRAGLVTHPYMLSVLAYADSSSPIHRGVFLARSLFGNVLRPPKDAVSPLAAELHPDLTTRQRVALQTKAVACQTCHTMINPLGFALEQFDAIGRFRTTERIGGVERPVDASGSYLPRTGERIEFDGGRELGLAVAASRDAREAFITDLFHAVVKQPVRAWGPHTLETLDESFVAHGHDIRRLLVDIMLIAWQPPTSQRR